MSRPVRLRIEDHPVAGEVTTDRWIAVPRTPRPALSWVLPLERQGQRQSAHQVRITADGSDPRDDLPAPWWDSGRRGGDGVRQPWVGSDLEPNRRYRWTVRCWDDHDEPGPWADPVVLDTGPFTAADWTADWVEVPATHVARGEVVLPSDAVQCRLHLTARGQVRAELDGIPVNGDCADPSRTTRRRALVRSYDVTDLTTAGTHVLDLVAAEGHDRGSGRVGLLAELVATLADGSLVRLGTGPGWLSRPSRVVHEEAFYLERHEPVPDPEERDVGWEPVHLVDLGEVLVEPDPSPPLHVVSWRRAPETGRAGDTVRIHDVGANVAGRTRVTLAGVRPGTQVRLVHGETLDADGRVSTQNIRLPWDRDRERQVLEHVCAGPDPEVVGPWFAVHGFRYVEVQGVPPDADVVMEVGVLHSDVPVTGTFRCDDPLLERLVAMAVRTQLNNLHSLPEDCPTREQSGWTGDAAASAAAAYAHLDMSGLYRTWLAGLADDQREDGAVPGVTPGVASTSAPPDPVWGAAYPVVVRQHWLHTGDASLVREHLRGLDRWCDYQLGLLVDGLVRRAEISYGHDWLAPEQTPPVMLQSCAVVSCLRTVAELEEACGEPATAARRRQQADEIVAAARSQLRDPVTGSWANGSQGALALAVTTGLARADEVPALLQQLRCAVHARGDRISSGFAATGAVVRALAAADGGSALLDCVHQGEQPGVGSMLVQGPGTFWETWWIDRDNVGVASLDHIGLAAPFAEWAWTHVAGLRPTGPGWSTFDVSPAHLMRTRRAEAVVATVRGQVRATWRRHGDRLRLEIGVPVGSTATVRVPGAATARVCVDGIDLSAGSHPHLSAVHVDAGDLVLEATAGVYLLDATGVRLPGVVPALGAVADLAPGDRIEVPLMVGAGGFGAPGGWTATVDAGWGAQIEPRGRDAVVLLTAPSSADVGDTTELRVHRDGSIVATATVRAGRSGRWLGDGVRSGSWSAGEAGTRVVWLPDGVVCEPVFHEPLPGPVAVVLGEPADPATPRSAVLRLDPPLDLGEAAGVMAHVDFCVPSPPGHSVHPVLRLTAADGSTVQVHGRPLPVGWNRLGAVVSGWSGRRALTTVEVAVHWTASPGGPDHHAGAEPFPVTFRLGRVGWTSAPLTW